MVIRSILPGDKTDNFFFVVVVRREATIYDIYVE